MTAVDSTFSYLALGDDALWKVSRLGHAFHERAFPIWRISSSMPHPAQIRKSPVIVLRPRQQSSAPLNVVRVSCFLCRRATATFCVSCTCQCIIRAKMRHGPSSR
jgi:hypothetical protein